MSKKSLKFFTFGAITGILTYFAYKNKERIKREALNAKEKIKETEEKIEKGFVKLPGRQDSFENDEDFADSGDNLSFEEVPTPPDWPINIPKEDEWNQEIYNISEEKLEEKTDKKTDSENKEANIEDFLKPEEKDPIKEPIKEIK